MDFRIKKIIGTPATDKRSLSIFPFKDTIAFTSCIGSGAVLVPLDKNNHHRPIHDNQIFYYHPPTPGSNSHSDLSPGSISGSPRAKADPAVVSTTSRLARVNKSSCADSNSQVGLVAVGESSGYMPSLILYDLHTGECQDIVRDCHQFGVQFVKFSPGGHYLVSLGTPQDGYIYVWNVAGKKLTLQASNKCITEVRDLQWINESQFITAGVRSVKIWTIETDSILNGRNVVLGQVADQTFECVLPLHREPPDISFLVGTSKGDVYRMPAVNLITSEPERPIKAMSIAGEDSSSSCVIYVSTSTNIFVYRDVVGNSVDQFESNQKPIMVHDHGTPALLSCGTYTFYVNTRGEFAEIDLLDTIGSINENPIEIPQAVSTTFKLFQKKGLQFKTSSCSSSDHKVLAWSGDTHSVLWWPEETLKIPLSDIVIADQSTDDEQEGVRHLIVGSLSGDIWLGDRCYNAHNGPVTDLHMLNSHLAISSGRDRCVQVWARASASWSLKQTILFATPILKSQLCINENQDIGLVCCGANKTLYIYRSSGIIDTNDETAPAFTEPPRSVLLKGMPLDATTFKSTVVISTNDKMLNIIDPWLDEKIVTSWRPVDSNGDTVNLTHLQPLRRFDTDLLLGAGSNKSIMLFTLQQGELMASQWGLGEPISGIAWTGDEVLAMGDALVISTICEAAEGDTIHRMKPFAHIPSSSLLSHTAAAASANSVSASPHKANPSSPTSSSPMRKVFGSIRSRSVSPTRGQARISPPRSPSPPPRSITRSPQLHERGRPGSISQAESSSTNKPNLAFKPFRMSSSAQFGQPLASSSSPNGLSSAKLPSLSSSDPAKQLQAALRTFLDKQTPNTHNQELKELLLAALNKVDGLAIFDQYTDTLCSQLRNCVESQISESLSKHLQKKM